MTFRAALTGKHDTLVRRAPCQPGALRIHLTRLSTEGLGPWHGEVRRANQMLNSALMTLKVAEGHRYISSGKDGEEEGRDRSAHFLVASAAYAYCATLC